MSRIIVKNLPSYLAEPRLRDHFAQKGSVTDIKLVHRPDGTFRRFAFIGFKTEKEANDATTYFNSTYIDSSRIAVEVVEDKKDAPRPNKRRRLSEDPLPVASGSKPKAITPKSKPALDDQLHEFMKAMQPRTDKGRSWANEATSEPIIVSEESTDQQEEGISDLEWMKRRMTKTLLESDTLKGAGTPEASSPADNPMLTPQDTILQTGRLFLRNLAFSCTEEDISAVLRPFGEITQIHIPLSPERTPKGLAYVTYEDPKCALAAFGAMDKKSFQGRLLHILPAVDRTPKDSLATTKSSLKQDRAKSKKEAATREFNWGMLYMNSDAVAASIADRMGISKSDILNSESDNAAVKLALAETHIIHETKAFFEKEGVILESLTNGSRRARSDTTILVKNIPYGTTATELQDMFGAHGEIMRLLIPPAGTMAVVEFQHPGDALKAFRDLAYKRIKNSILYLEKAPSGMFADKRGDHITVSSAAPITIKDHSKDSEDVVPGTVLFIKNLAFSTMSDRLTSVFKHTPEFAFARVQMKPDAKRPGERLSMGYGFVGFNTPAAAKNAMSSMQGFVLDGHALLVKFSGRGVEDDKPDPTSAKGKTAKMIVKNVPFEATKKDIRELFGAHGHLKSVRLPRKIDAKSRGFAFLEFVSRKEAENAFATLRHTHLLGRHLVLDWADEDANVDDLREKVAVSYGSGGQLPGKKRKLELHDDVEDGV